MKLLTVLLLAFSMVLMAGCTPSDGNMSSPGRPDDPVSNTPLETPAEPMPDDLAPRSDDAKLTRRNVYIESMELLTLESYPPQFMLHITGSTPTPCNMLRVEVSEPDADNVISISVYSVSDTKMICAQVLAPFDRSIPIKVDKAGSYQVVVNGNPVGEIVMP